MLHLKTFRMRSIGWALFGVNFRPLQEIEAIMGMGGYLILDPFSRDYGTLCICLAVGFGNYPTHMVAVDSGGATP